MSDSQLVLLGQRFDVWFGEDFQSGVAIDVFLLQGVDRPLGESSILIELYKRNGN